MKILITGSRGFIGSNLLKKLSYLQADIRCLLHSNNGRKYFIETNNKSYVVDFSDIDSLLNCDAFQDIQYVFHLAGITRGITKKQFYEANVVPTKNLLETIRLRNLKIKRFVFLSSQAAGGPATSLDSPKNPDDPSVPVEYYGWSKLTAELILQKYSEVIPVTILRPSAVYGPGDRDFLKLFKMINASLQVFGGTKIIFSV